MNERPAPLLQAARLFAKTSARGSDYMSGRMGNLKVLILANKQHDPADPAQAHTHALFFTEPSLAPGKPQQVPLPFVPRSPLAADPPGEPLPWDGQPSARTSYDLRPDNQFKKRAAGGGKARLPEDPLPFNAECR